MEEFERRELEARGLDAVRYYRFKGCEERPEEREEEAERREVDVAIAGEADADDHRKQGEVGEGWVALVEHQRVDGDGEERSGGADDLVEGDSYEVAVRGVSGGFL